MSTAKATSEVQVQTILQVRPFILDYPEFAKITANKKNVTEISIRPIEDIKKFYSLLQYTPFQDIKKDAIRVVELPRLTKLTFEKRSRASFIHLVRNMDEVLLSDDDAISELCADIIKKNDFPFLDIPTTSNSTQTSILAQNTDTDTLPEEEIYSE
ncbi:uncharacterized protein LOC126265088 [Aethina tumida]|uniref:uncharacterized protein LOC126265088 n=1 Tax=Aethina tumida TaxID=116153 RepID=UPI0021487F52|nr:uncharacterized protein LOC126265088 [Aethina tumida]